MSNQIETPKVVLTKQAEIPKVALSGTPVAALGEGVSGILSSIANILPEAPALPTGVNLGSKGLPQLPKIKDFAVAVEETGLPLPKVSQALGQFEKTVGGVSERGTITEEKPPVGGVATRGSL
jgi:hypothetical protein